MVLTKFEEEVYDGLSKSRQPGIHEKVVQSLKDTLQKENHYLEHLTYYFLVEGHDLQYFDLFKSIHRKAQRAVCQRYH